MHKCLAIIIAGVLIMLPSIAAAAELVQGFPLPGGQSQGGEFRLDGVAGLPAGGLSSGGTYSLSGGLVFSSSGVLLSSTSVSVSESGSDDTYTMRLLTKPTSDVTITIDVDDTLKTSPSALTFNPSNWSAAQTVSVLAVDDSKIQGPHHTVIKHTAASADPAYNAIAINEITVHITDDDSAGILIKESDSGTTITEGGSGTYQVSLTSQPKSDVTVNVNTPYSIAADTVSLEFDADNWNAPKTVTISVPDDDLAQGSRSATVGHSITSADSNFNGLTLPSVTVNILDNDAPGVNIAKGGVAKLTEGASGSFQINLVTQPASDVTVNMDDYDSKEISVSPSAVTFTPSNWDMLQSATIQAADDSVIQGNRSVMIGIYAISSDSDYNGITIPDVEVLILDNDKAGMLITESDGNTTVTEGGSGDSYIVQLTAKPTRDVSIQISDSSQLDITPAALIFTTENWNKEQTVIVSAVDDTQREGSHSELINHTVQSDDLFYQTLSPSAITVNIIDNDHSSSGHRNQNEEKPVDSDTGSGDINPNLGGRIILHKNISLDIPKGALSGNSKVSVQLNKVDEIDKLPSNYRYLEKSCRVTVGETESYQFPKPVKLSFQFAESMDLQGADIYYFDDTQGEWIGLGGTVTDGTITAEIDHSGDYVVLSKENKAELNDISKHWAKESIEKVAKEGIIKGYPDGSFKPNRKITRAEFVTAMVNALNLQFSHEKVFTDTSDHWAKESISIAASCGLIKGFTDEVFRPDEPITREQMALIATNAAEMEGKSTENNSVVNFKDNQKISTWAKKGVDNALEQGIMKGYPDQTFQPQGEATRAESVCVILSLIK